MPSNHIRSPKRLPEADVFHFRHKIGISRLNSDELSSACKTLSPILKSDNLIYAFVDVNIGEGLAKMMLDRAAAYDRKKKRKAKGRQESKLVASRFSSCNNLK